MRITRFSSRLFNVLQRKLMAVPVVFGLSVLCSVSAWCVLLLTVNHDELPMFASWMLESCAIGIGVVLTLLVVLDVVFGDEDLKP